MKLDTYISSIAANPIGCDGQPKHADQDTINACQRYDMYFDSISEANEKIHIENLRAENVAKCYGITVEQARSEGYI